MIMRPRSIEAPTVSRKFSSTCVTCAVANVALPGPATRNSRLSKSIGIPFAIETERTPLTAVRLSRTPRIAASELRSLPAAVRSCAPASPSVGKPNSAVRARSIMTPLVTRNGIATAI